jgi:hypothetical protein
VSDVAKEIAEIAARAAEKKLPFLIAGGHAVITHGYERTTFDADLSIRHQDRDSWLAIMKDLGYTLFFEGPAFAQFNPPAGGRLPVDLMFTGRETFEQFDSEAIPNPRGNHLPKIVSLKHLIAMKCHAIIHGHPGRIVKDADDVIHLFLANRLDPNAPQWREIILKYGNAELYEKLRRICES